MKKSKIINLEHKQYEKELKDIVDEMGLLKFEHTALEIPLTAYEKQLLIKCTKYSILTLITIIEDEGETIALNMAFNNQLILLELLEDSKVFNTLLKLVPGSFHWILISLEIGGEMNLYEVNAKSKLWNNKEYESLTNLYENVLKKCKIISKIISPWEIPEYLKGR